MKTCDHLIKLKNLPTGQCCVSCHEDFDMWLNDEMIDIVIDGVNYFICCNTYKNLEAKRPKNTIDKGNMPTILDLIKNVAANLCKTYERNTK